MTIQAPERPQTASGVRGMKIPRLPAGSLTRPFGLPPRIAAGRTLLLLLFVVIPLVNPAIAQVGDERLYAGTVIVIVAAALMLPSVLSRRFDWIVVGLVFGVLYVLEAGVLRGDFRLGVLGNTYRPLHAVLAFAACAVFLLGTERERWVRLFLVGGLVGCSLAVVNTLVPAIDPFALSRPDIGYEARFLTSDRQEGAFVYPGNFGPYAAYVALVALVMVERKSLRPLSLNLYTATFVFGVLGMITSGSRGAVIGFLLGALVVLWRSPRFRVPFALTLAAAVAVVSVALLAAGKFREIVESRILLADFSFEERLRSWETAWDGLRHSVLFGGGVLPNTIDSTVIYYLGVGGVVGLLLVAAMYWTTLLRPTWLRDWANLPLVVAVAGVGLTQEALGTPLTSWAIAAAMFLTTTPERERELFASDRRVRLVPRTRRETAAVTAALVAIALAAVGAVAAGRVEVGGLRTGPVLEVAEVIRIAEPPRTTTDVVATTSADDASQERIWLASFDGQTVRASRYAVAGISVDEERDAEVTARTVAEIGPRPPDGANVDVVRWTPRGKLELAILRVGARTVTVETLPVSGGVRPIVRGQASLLAAAPGRERAAGLARWGGTQPDLFVVEHGRRRRIAVDVYSGESGFKRRLESGIAQRSRSQGSSFTVDVARITGPLPDVILTTLRGPTGDPQVHVLSGESGFRRFILQVRIDLSRLRAVDYRFAAGVRRDEPVLYVLGQDSVGDARLAVVPLLYLPETSD